MGAAHDSRVVLRALPQPHPRGQGRAHQLVLHPDARGGRVVLRRRSRGGAGAPLPDVPRRDIAPDFSPRGRIGSSFGRSRRDSGLHCSRARAAGAFRRDPIGVCDARSKRSLATKCPFFSSTEGNAEPKRDRRGAIAPAPIARPPRAPLARRATRLPRADSPADRARRPAPGREPAPTALSEFSIARAKPWHRTPPRTG